MAYKFVDRFDAEQEVSCTKSFFQLASFVNNKTGGHHVRRFIVNSDGNIINVKNYVLNEEKYKGLISKLKNYEYVIYSTHSLINTDYPRSGELMLLRSSILTSNCCHTGYASFDKYN